ncbi:hypothetical protein KIN20_029569 [Parelaphostrongylus tenuis]|uniref:Uncharacterized protein n=1 Tax=Parelaphostrongylus tenuis TaxID=148309 RepID=A0AAD5R2N4_PARTN|nr:hypothetical protein KIN20_029569 [Parelaphostrongylus tenuis]
MIVITVRRRILFFNHSAKWGRLLRGRSMAFESSARDRQQAKRSVYTAGTDVRWATFIANKKDMAAHHEFFQLEYAVGIQKSFSIIKEFLPFRGKGTT